MTKQASQETQLDRFRRMAHEVEADESDDALDRAMGKLNLRVKPKTPPPEPPADEADK